MKTLLWVLLLAVSTAASSYASEARRDYQSIPLAPETTVVLRGSAASVLLRPGPVHNVAVDLRVLCSGELISCRRDAAGVAVGTATRDGKLILQLAGPINFMRPDSQAVKAHCPSLSQTYSVRAGKLQRGQLLGGGKPRYKMSATLTVDYPATSKLEVDLEVGHVTVVRPRAAVDARLQRGVLGLFAAQAAIGAVEARASRAELELPDREMNQSGHKISWMGRGTADVALAVKRGFAVVQVER